eukprot:s782_g14.t1
MDRRRKFDFLDAATATAAAAEAAPQRGGELVDVGAAARPLRGAGRLEPAERMRAAETSLKALQGTLTSSANAVDAESRVHVFAEALPEDVAKVGPLHVDDGGALVMSSVLLSGGKLHLVQERQRFGEPLGSLEVKGKCRAFDLDHAVSLLLNESRRDAEASEVWHAAAISYGATGVGKTFWQEKLQHAVGLKLLKKESAEKPLEISMVEVMETCTDLLASSPESSNVKLQSGAGTLISCLPFYPIHSATDLEHHLATASAKRASTPTEQSPNSSRTHLVAVLRSRGMEVMLVDLAGSERASDRQKHGTKLLEEAKAINWSLACLHECVRCVAEKTTCHVPLRRTLITRLLEGVLMLQGSSQVVWLAHVHPSSQQIAHSLHTFTVAGDILKAALAQQRRSKKWSEVPPKSWTKEQLSRWLADSFPSLPSDTFSWADGPSFAREWERDLVARAELAGASKDDALRAYEAFHALRPPIIQLSIKTQLYTVPLPVRWARLKRIDPAFTPSWAPQVA